MTNITRLRHALPLSQGISKILTELDNAIAKAIEAAKAAGLPQGLILAATGSIHHEEHIHLIDAEFSHVTIFELGEKLHILGISSQRLRQCYRYDIKCEEHRNGYRLFNKKLQRFNFHKPLRARR